MNATVGDIVTWTSPAGRVRIGRVAAALENPAGTPPKTVTVATPEGDFVVEPATLRVVRSTFVQETWAALGDTAETSVATASGDNGDLKPIVNRKLRAWPHRTRWQHGPSSDRPRG